jgi:hypothetical protein
VPAVLFIFNAIIYFYRFKIGILFTSMLIVLGIFNVVHFFYVTEESSFWIGIKIFGKISTPAVDERLLLIFILAVILNFGTHKEIVMRIIKIL